MKQNSNPKSEPKSNKSRREFLKSAATAGGVAAAVAFTGKNVMASVETEILSESKKTKGYEETQHIRDYYNTARK